ncbi:MAG: bifunctional phosphoribosyl-AMP cyclohydrolase/phosphoribosyl-ATP diphosphatase HisIE [Thermoanaerobaculia bacterium]|jgi:phosphoribosyl-ATP pyrophosphohydrolase/phosphoribosyl-AMP cyclohydrolase|nr:MAG: bifunctional phosphoribosyl-AMP cyclohydrolase/phosphoribosyl-ATP diphosphatase HisIE [Thermoanaerobaculia bacterium]MBZ0101092.1 bifunctional phosphoribosyl-AMP cyclohydrolase/phosphoribosyl-ATP diphosphatase HisIE [Thermoanaerobaculia bacterium]
MSPDPPGSLAWEANDGLLPAIVQDADTRQVRMLGWMSRESLAATLASRRVTFWSRSRGRLWTKGESSGNYLELVAVEPDCDGDALLVLARPLGPTCHLGRPSCFAAAPGSFLAELDALVERRHRDPPAGSYCARLFAAGPRAIAQKVGEEAVETALAAVAQDDDALLGEAADLLFHLQVLLRSRGLSLAAVEAVLSRRQASEPEPSRPATSSQPPEAAGA